MHRKYRPWHYRQKIESIREAMPGAAIGADVMVGFPGESDAEFEETCRLIEDLPLTYLHVFSYSARPGTPAVEMRNQVAVAIARERNRVLRDLAEQKKRRFMESFVGKKLSAITLNVSTDSHTEALTDNYLRLQLRHVRRPNHWVNAKIEAIENGILVGA
jgi:threonylcarbamoyladenosine tRNA methylthiotransferase MtaB